MNRAFDDINKDIKNISSSTSKLGSDVTNIGSSSIGGLSDLPKTINLPSTSETPGDSMGRGNLSSTSSNLPVGSIVSDISGVGSSNVPLSQGISSTSEILSGSSHVLPSSSISSNLPRVEEATNLKSNIDESNKNIGGSSNLSGKLF